MHEAREKYYTCATHARVDEYCGAQCVGRVHGGTMPACLVDSSCVTRLLVLLLEVDKVAKVQTTVARLCVVRKLLRAPVQLTVDLGLYGLCKTRQ
jgi:hypothetical protein